jgi:hypothetical protein
MKSLAALQSNFQAYLHNVDDVSTLESLMVNDEKVGAKKRLSIYAEAYYLRIIEALGTTYPKLKQLVGDTLFVTIARSYLTSYPSTYRNMRWVGDEMASHLEKTLPNHPITAEMAYFEWALGIAFDAADQPILSINDLSHLSLADWPSLMLKAQQSVQCLHINWNVLPVWQALDQAEEPPKITPVDQHCIVWRKDLDPHYRSVDPLEITAVKQIQQGTTFGELCAYLQLNLNEEAATQKAAEYLTTWLDDGLLIKN